MSWLAVLGVVAVPALARAEGSTSTMDTTAVTTMLTSIQTGLVGLLNSAMPIVTAVVLAGLALWAGLVIVRIIKRVFARAG